MAAQFDMLRAHPASGEPAVLVAARPLVKNRCAEGKAKTQNVSSAEKATLRVVDLFVAEGDHPALQAPGCAKAVPGVDRIIWVAVQAGNVVHVLLLLVELKDGGWGVSNVRNKFENSWGHPGDLGKASDVRWQHASLHLLALDAKKREDRTALKKPIRQCAGHAPNLERGAVGLETLVGRLL